jgi:hypothetical protein
MIAVNLFVCVLTL